MVEILRRVHLDDQDGDESGDQEPEVDLTKLTKQQLEDFQRDITSGRIQDILEQWIPWWEQKVTDDRPQVPKNLPALTTISTATPSPLLPFLLVDILYSYAFVQRLMNGDVEDDVMECVATIMELSSVLKSNAVYHSGQEAIYRCIETANQPSLFNSAAFSVMIIDDVTHLLIGTNPLSAMFDLNQIFLSALEIASQEKGSKEKKKQILNCQRRVFYFLLWSQDLKEDQLDAIRSSIETISIEQKEMIKSRKPETKSMLHITSDNNRDAKSMPVNKPLIQPL
eukprot:TRINITY_DN5026_c0_g1_i1.p1 TRINITY_DN5026_c0_g1~~TRINITY_DN5026_c0_g1_i1.p1  ORF type:complete len:282 (+),score=72.61 TRINITY_DN5026_c0_g1_i1:508-1353(+)